jgi:L-lysine exporter family protein LysE/ArgO
MEVFFLGIGTGILISMMLGTVFFALIQNSIDNGYKSGLVIALGVVCSDLFFISMAVLGTSFLPDIPKMPFYSSLLGGLLLLIFGLVSIFRTNPKLVYPKTKLGHLGYYFTTGFLLNVLNPVNFLIWVALVAKLRSEYSYSEGQIYFYLASSLLGIFIAEGLISFLAQKLQRLFTPKLLHRINQLTGVIFVVFSFRLFYGAFFLYF